MSERWSPKKVIRRRVAEIARGAPPHLPSAAPVAPPLPPDLLCRAHGQPWRSCMLCSSPSSKKGPQP